MADARICDVGETLVPLNIVSWNGTCPYRT